MVSPVLLIKQSASIWHTLIYIYIYIYIHVYIYIYVKGPMSATIAHLLQMGCNPVGPLKWEVHGVLHTMDPGLPNGRAIGINV